jgi:hypothetical protein
MAPLARALCASIYLAIFCTVCNLFILALSFSSTVSAITTNNNGNQSHDPDAKNIPEVVTLPMKEFVSFSKTVRCRHELMSAGKGHSPSCLVPEEKCGRRVIDGVFSPSDVQPLLEIAKKGMRQRESIGGPTILDINTGYIRDSLGLENLFIKVRDRNCMHIHLFVYVHIISYLMSFSFIIHTIFLLSL